MKTEAAKQQGKLEQQITTLKDQLNKKDTTLKAVDAENKQLIQDAEYRQLTAEAEQEKSSGKAKK
jgi:hypothetical protein